VSDNLYAFKKKIRPDWYEDGPCKVFSREEIDEWESKDNSAVYAKIEAERGLSLSDVKFLDSLKEAQCEMQFQELLEGTVEKGDVDVNK
jgi:hypothetical protein